MAGARALVIGGSMSGLLAALALQRRGFEVTVYERVSDPLAGRGAGIVAQPELKAICARSDWIRTTISASRSRTADVRALRQHHSSRARVQQTMTAWDRVFILLKAALPETKYHTAKELRRVEQGDGS